MCIIYRSIFIVCIILPSLTGCSPDKSPSTTPSVVAESPTTPSQVIILPKPDLNGTLSLEEALANRRSVRDYSDKPLTIEEIGQLLWAAQGITDTSGHRTAPSAGALYPLEIYVLLPDGFFHYIPAEHHLVLQKPGDLRTRLHTAALQQDSILNAPAIFVITAVYARTESKYGKERSPRYVHLEAGHAAQNLLLQAVALDLGAVPIGAFLNDQVIEVLSLPDDHKPQYLIPVGNLD